jgi:hypothetical protein
MWSIGGCSLLAIGNVIGQANRHVDDTMVLCCVQSVVCSYVLDGVLCEALLVPVMCFVGWDGRCGCVVAHVHVGGCVV